MSHYLVILLWLCFAMVFVLGKELLGYFNFLDFVALRFLLAGPLLLLFHQRFRRHRKISFGRKKEKVIAVVCVFCLAFLQFFLPFTLEYWAQRSLTASKVSLVFAFSPFVTFLIALVLQKENVSWTRVGGLTLGVLGAAFAFLTTPNNWLSLEWGFVLTSADWAMLAAVFSSCLAWVLTPRLLDHGFSPSLINGAAMLLAGVMTMASKTVIVHDFAFTYLLAIPKIQWLYFILIIILSSFVGYPLYTKLLRHYSPSFISLSGFLCPIFTALLGWTFLGEPIMLINLFLSITLGSLGMLLYNLG